MTSLSVLIFRVQEALYGVAAQAVREIIWLPALSPLPDAPPHIAGLLNLRGKIVPVINLGVRLGHAPQRLRLSDSIVIVECAPGGDDADGTDGDGADGDGAGADCEPRLAGLLVSEVRDVRLLSGAQTETSSVVGADEIIGDTRLVAAIGKIESDIVTLLNLDNLLRLPHGMAVSEPSEGAAPGFWADATPEEIAVLRERALYLLPAVSSQEQDGYLPLAVVRLNDEFFGIDLGIVREFGTIHRVTPVPCCPSHIVGQMNLRGEILTLLDIRGALRMPVNLRSANGDDEASPASADVAFANVMVAQSGDLRVGVVIDDVCDVAQVRPEDVTPVPAATHAATHDYLRGAAPYGEKMLLLLDLPKLLSSEVLVVNEEA